MTLSFKVISCHCYRWNSPNTLNKSVMYLKRNTAKLLLSFTFSFWEKIEIHRKIKIQRSKYTPIWIPSRIDSYSYFFYLLQVYFFFLLKEKSIFLLQMRLKSCCSPACIIFLSPFPHTAWNFVGSIPMFYIFTYIHIYIIS